MENNIPAAPAAAAAAAAPPSPRSAGIAAIDSILGVDGKASLTSAQVADLVSLRDYLASSSASASASVSASSPSPSPPPLPLPPRSDPHPPAGGNSDREKAQDCAIASKEGGDSDRAKAKAAAPAPAAAGAAAPDPEKAPRQEQQQQQQQRRSSSSIAIPQDLVDSADRGSETSAYLASEYGGMTEYSHVACLNSKVKQREQRERLRKRFIGAVKRVMHGQNMVREMKAMVSERRLRDMAAFVPKEWHDLDSAARAELTAMLSWEGSCRWDFDVLRVAELTGGQPLLFVGWAILASPYAQDAMVASCARGADGAARAAAGAETSAGETSDTQAPGGGREGGYDFFELCNVYPSTLCSFLRIIESDYRNANPYHNSTHAADVLQSTHALVSRFEAHRYASNPLELYSLLLSAAIHDVDHPGTTNAYQVNLRTKMALRYNDEAVLENMHLAKAFQRLMGPERREDMDVLGGLEPDQVACVRTFVIRAVRSTDMSRHFVDVARIRAAIDELPAPPGPGSGGGGNEDEQQHADDNYYPRLLMEQNVKGTSSGETEDTMAAAVLRLVLHLADISSQAKPAPLFEPWTDRVLAEFFAQGDMERERDMPVSPLCDRHTTARAESQVGFIKFVVKPAYEVLGRLLPRVAEEILPMLDTNLTFWEREMEKEKEQQSEKKEME